MRAHYSCESKALVARTESRENVSLHIIDAFQSREEPDQYVDRHQREGPASHHYLIARGRSFRCFVYLTFIRTDAQEDLMLLLCKYGVVPTLLPFKIE